MHDHSCGNTSLWHADKGKKSRFRQLTDLVKTGVSAATSKVGSKANSRLPSRGVTQDLEGFEATDAQSDQAALEPAVMEPSKNVSQKEKKSMPSTGHPEESAHETAAARPVAEGHAHSRHAASMHADALTEFAEILAAQPLRSASSAALLSHYPRAQRTPHTNTTQMHAVNPHPKDRAMPIAEGTEARQPVKANPPKIGPGFMSGASTGRGAAPKAPVAEAAAASAGKANQIEQESAGLLHEAHADDVPSMRRYCLFCVTLTGKYAEGGVELATQNCYKQGFSCLSHCL